MLFSVGFIKSRIIFWKDTYVSAILILESTLFHSFIAKVNKEFLKDTVWQNDSPYQLYFSYKDSKFSSSFDFFLVVFLIRPVKAKTAFYWTYSTIFLYFLNKRDLVDRKWNIRIPNEVW